MEPVTINQSMVLEFNKVLEEGRVTTLFQPIVDMKSGRIYAFEALSRGPENSLLNSPLVLLSVAKLLNKTWELEQLLRVKAIEQATFTDKYKLFLNVDPNVIKDSKFKSGFTKERLKAYGVSPDDIVLELTERTAIESYQDFKIILDHYKDQGYHIALDDAGAGYSGLKTLYEVYPKFLKIDMDFIRHIERDKFKQAIVKSFVEIARLADMKTIAEGVETMDELKTLIGMGVDYGQGYYIQRPSQEIKPLSPNVLNVIERENKLIHQVVNYSEEYHFIHHLIKERCQFPSDTRCRDVFECMNLSQLKSIPIVENKRLIGLVFLREINKAFAKQFGYSVYSHRPIDLIVNKSPMVVDYYDSILEVANKALKRDAESLYDDIVVLKGHDYAGIITMSDLLDYAINYEKNHARELNPLTGLPGNPIINRVMTSLLETERSSCVIYADLNNFKVYNDVYGFERGNQVLKMTSEVLQKAIDRYMPYSSFLGHIGGDDFIVVSSGEPTLIQAFCEEVIVSFDERMKSFLLLRRLY
ncbi:GGDEF domain-containing protein [Acidaminobacter sp. JC074]|uniref:GGDEF domain-containing protein n=1 Tax=Acidaminobacter sp. JC074 TaxID=2530199 RepID=UPI001F0F71C1|nr:GGDEF domain-containing protein [Acidaminobacter sp. JC074]